MARRVERQLDHAEGERKRIHQRAFFQKGLRRFVAALGRERHQLLTEQLVLSQVALAAQERAAVGHGIDAGPADVDDLILSDGDALADVDKILVAQPRADLLLRDAGCDGAAVQQVQHRPLLLAGQVKKVFRVDLVADEKSGDVSHG